MSHFTCLVIGPDPERQLAGFHEFECTGIDEDFVLDLDVTEEYRAGWRETKQRFLVSPEGERVEAYADRFYRDPTPEELGKIGPIFGTGGGHGMSWTSKDWGDGQGYRPKIHFIPEGWEEVMVPYSETMPFAEFCEYWYSTPLLPAGGSLDLNAIHKYGYARLGRNGEVARVIKRTNPCAGVWRWHDDEYSYGTAIGDALPPALNHDPTTDTYTDHNGAPIVGRLRKEQIQGAKWDWYELGGRWKGLFILKPTGLGTVLKDHAARKGQIDFERMRNEAALDAYAEWDKVQIITQGETWEPWLAVIARFGNDFDGARQYYHAQPPVMALQAARYFNMDHLLRDREGFADDARLAAGVTFAVIKDGVWYERGQMGWFGCVSHEKDKGEWYMQFCELLSDVPDDTLLSVYDCHI